MISRKWTGLSQMPRLLDVKTSVEERLEKEEVILWKMMDFSRMRIPPEVKAKQGENPCYLKGMGSLTMIVSQGLVGPKVYLIWIHRKGNRLIFLYLADTSSNGIISFDGCGILKQGNTLSKHYSAVEYCKNEKQHKVRKVRNAFKRFHDLLKRRI